jgi:hypothetical protein
MFFFFHVRCCFIHFVPLEIECDFYSPRKGCICIVLTLMSFFFVPPCFSLALSRTRMRYLAALTVLLVLLQSSVGAASCITSSAATCRSLIWCTNNTLTRCTLGCYTQLLQCYANAGCDDLVQNCPSTLSGEQLACKSSLLPCWSMGTCDSDHLYRCAQARVLIAPRTDAYGASNEASQYWIMALGICCAILLLVVFVLVGLLRRAQNDADQQRRAHEVYETETLPKSNAPSTIGTFRVMDPRRMSPVSLEFSSSKDGINTTQSGSTPPTPHRNTTEAWGAGQTSASNNHSNGHSSNGHSAAKSSATYDPVHGVEDDAPRPSVEVLEI